MKTLILDIETAPKTAEELEAFPISDRAIKRYVEEKKGVEMVSRTYAEKTLKKEQAENAQLNAMHSRICAIGWLWLDDETDEVIKETALAFADDQEGDSKDEQERSLLSGLFDVGLPMADRVVGHKGRGYDLPMLWQRAIILGVSTEKARRQLMFRGRQFDHEKVLCTKALWQCGQPKYDRPMTGDSLDDICRALGWPTKPGNAKDFWQWPREKQIEYLTHDVETEARLYLRLRA